MSQNWFYQNKHAYSYRIDKGLLKQENLLIGKLFSWHINIPLFRKTYEVLYKLTDLCTISEGSSIKSILTIKIDSCLRRSSSKEIQSSKSYTLMHNLTRVEEEKLSDGKSRSDKHGHSPVTGWITLNCFRFLKKLKIRTYTFSM